MSLNHYPTQFPRDEIGVVMNYLRGAAGVDAACTLEAAWWLAGYGLSFVPHNHPPLVGAGGESLEAHLEKMLAVQGNVDAATAFPWAIIIPLVVNLIRKLLERK